MASIFNRFCGRARWEIRRSWCQPIFPLPPPGFPTFSVWPTRPSMKIQVVTVNTYDQLVNDSDIGANPDVAYVTGTGAFDQIFITRISKTQAKVTVNAYTDNTYTQLISSHRRWTRLCKDRSATTSIFRSLLFPVAATIASRLRSWSKAATTTTKFSSTQRWALSRGCVQRRVADVKMLNITGNGNYTRAVHAQWSRPLREPDFSSSAPGLIAEAS